MKPLLRIFVLSDTHDRLPATIPALAQGMDEIWHLGDVCQPGVLAEVEKIGPPVTLVRGNCDSYVKWPLTVNLERHGLRFRLEHIPPKDAPKGIDVLLHGHTHVPLNERRHGVHFLNPGCVTRPNRGAPASVAILEIAADRTLHWELIGLR